MTKVKEKFLVNRSGGTATAMLLAFLLFYFPSVLSLFSRDNEPPTWLLTGVVMATFYTLVFCINYFLIVPWSLIHPEKKSFFFLLNFIIIAVDCCLIAIWFEASGGIPLPKGKQPESFTTMQYLLSYLRFIIRDGIMMVLSAALAYALRLSEARERIRRRDLELSAEQQRIELRNLKAQLNPHFLFNSLNNIYALIGFAPDRAQTALHDLSNMLRFMIYDSGNTTVPLAKEMQFISDYSALMRLRLNSNIDVECNLMPSSASDILSSPVSDINVTPLLFLTLVENAFKHVAPLGDGKGFICINIDISGSSDKGQDKKDDKFLTCTVSNTYNETSVHSKSGFSASSTDETLSDTKKGESGVGLENVRRQLRLLYPEGHELSIEKKNGIFTAGISISLPLLRS